MSADYLAHYGVLGQKWGVRRFQNQDGSLTPEGRKRYRKEFRQDNKKAFELGREATVLGQAAKYAANRAAKLEDRALKKHEKDPSGLKKGTQRASDKAEAAEKAALTIAEEYAKAQQAAKDHCNELMKKYGRENVKDISYKNLNVSKSAASKLGKDSLKVMNEKTTDLTDWALAGLGTIASASFFTLFGLPISMIYVPASKEMKGNAEALNAYNTEYHKIQNKKRYGVEMPKPATGFRNGQQWW